MDSCRTIHKAKPPTKMPKYTERDRLDIKFLDAKAIADIKME